LRFRTLTQQRHAIITGGSSGIGLAIAADLLAKGWNLTIIARDPARLDAAKAQLEGRLAGRTQQVLAISCDVSDLEGVDAAIGQAIDSLGPPEMLITSAGIAHPGYFAEMPLEIFRDTMEINYFGTLYAVRAVLPAMRRRGGGHVVMISSGAGLIGIFGYSAYAPTKFALRGLAETLRGELKGEGIRVSIVYPPDTDTPQLAAENEIKPPETAGITGNAKVLSAEAVAHAVLKGVERNRFQITPGWEMRLLALLHSLLAPLLFRYFDALAAKAAKRKPSSPPTEG
jgi:3-dehydrosphinganine reductase